MMSQNLLVLLKQEVLQNLEEKTASEPEAAETNYVDRISERKHVDTKICPPEDTDLSS